MSDVLEFPLAQGWSLGLTCKFETVESSKSFAIDDHFHVDQVHGKEIYPVTASDMGRRGPLAKADGLYAQGDWFRECGQKLVVKTADCAPLLYIDALSQSVAAVHAGWRGLQKGIHRVPFERRWFDPKSTWVWLGPCLSGKTFEVGNDMWKQFPSRVQSDTQVFEPHAVSNKRYFSTWKYLEKEFASIGVPLLYNVEVDTFLDRDFASYRRARSEGLEKAKDRNLSWVGFGTQPLPLKPI